MSEPFMRPRQDMSGYDPQDQRQGHGENPLAELARLVGKDDPFRAATRPASNVARFPQLAPPRSAPDVTASDGDFRDYAAAGHPDFDAQLRGSLEARRHDEASLRFPQGDDTVEAFEPALGYPAAGGRGEAPPLNADLWAEGAHAQDAPVGDLFHEPAHAPADARSPRRTLMVLAAVVALTGGGIGATFLMRDGAGVRLGGGAPPTIMASDTPVKVQSPDMANGGTADANTALLEKTNSDKVDSAKVVATDEQPVDLNQLPKAASTQGDSAAAAGTSPSPFPEPRKVKTVLVRPDGSVVGEAPQAPAASQQPVGMVLPMEAGGPPPAEPVAKPSSPKSTARATSTPATSASGASGAKQPAAPVRAPKPAVVASAAPAPTEDAPAATPGTWAVQLGAPPSEQEAKEMSSRLQKKFASELGGLKPAIVKADRDGKSIYRVRVGNLAQADAKALCAKLQAGGGSCFAVRN